MKPPAFRPEWHNALMSDKERGYAHRVDIRAGTQQVWRALTEAEQLKGWCSPDAEIRARKGGLFRASVDRVTELEAHIDEFILEPVPGGTIVRLLGSGVPATPQWDTQYRRLRTGWQQAIVRLKVVVERQAGPGASPWWDSCCAR